MSEFCEHSKCEFGNRPEYCTVEAARPDEAAGLVILSLDAILYEGEHVAGEGYSLTSDNSEQLLQRSFSYLHGDLKSFVWPLVETQADISHRIDKKTGMESYAVEVGWKVHQNGAADDRFVVRYYIDFHPRGNVQAEIEEPDIVMGERTVRPMGGYDYEKLYTELDMLMSTQNAERRDNARAVDVSE